MDQVTKYSSWNTHSVTSARVDLAVDNNGTWSDAFQFGDPDDLSWTLAGCAFELDVQRSQYDTVPLVSMSTGNGKILIDSDAQRVIHFDLPASEIQASLQPGVYVYDLVMIDSTTVRVPLMHGTLTVTQGVTYP
jgi:hypothetical protein